MFPVEGSVEPIPGHEGETRRRMWVFYASVVVSIAITTLTTHLMYKKHFGEMELLIAWSGFV